jgi:hypothetical protein
MSSTRKSPAFRDSICENVRSSDRNTPCEPGRALASPLKEAFEPEVITIERPRDRSVTFEPDGGGKDMLNRIVEQGTAEVRSDPLSLLKYVFREDNSRIADYDLQARVLISPDIASPF